MSPKIYLADFEKCFKIIEEPKSFRCEIIKADIRDEHVEDFLDTTVEWLSSNPDKGMLIDFKGVRSVCTQFVIQLQRNFEEIKRRGLPVRFVNVDPSIREDIEGSDITVVITHPFPEKPVLSAKELLDDLANNVSDTELMKKHGLSEKGLQSMYKKLLKKGLITKKELAKRWGTETSEITVARDGLRSPKVEVDVAEVLADIAENYSDRRLMEKYRLSVKGLRSLFKKLRRKNLISKQAFLERRHLWFHEE